MKRRTELALHSAIALAIAGILPSTASYAQDSEVPAEESGAQVQESNTLELEEVVVTARKREENLQEIPIAITAVSAKDILEGDITGLEDISALAPGFYFFNQGGSQPGRYNTQLRFRGLNQAQFSPSFETGALFIDGVYVLNGGTSLSLMDIERVEVIKGPQAAYFGRNTFGGAVNFITRDPSMDEWSGELSMSATDRERYDISGIVEGPIIQDTLAGSLSFRMYDKKGQFTASDGGVLGDEETWALNGKLLWQPTDSLTVKLRAAYTEDDDGPPAQAYIAGRKNDSCAGKTIQVKAGGTANPYNFICGAVPEIGDAVPVTGSAVIDGNTQLPNNLLNLFGFGPLNIEEAYANQDLPSGIPSLGRLGLLRETLRLSAHITYEINDYSIDFVAGHNDQKANFVRDFDLSGFSNGYSSDPQALDDTSFELRLTSPQNGRFRWSVGVNYYEQEFTSSLAGGNFYFGCFGAQGGNTESPCLNVGGLDVGLGPFANSYAQSDETEVLGYFGSIDFDITDNLTFTLEGRRQNDTLTKGGASTKDGLGEGSTELEFNKTLPRAIIRWQPFDSTMVYASYAEGIVPGDINIELVNADEQELAQYVAAFPTLAPALPPEEIETVELGWKQTFADGAAYFNAAVYFSEWTGIKGRSSVAVNETCTSADVASSAPGCTYNGVIADETTKQLVDANNDPTGPLKNARNVLLDGDADLWGYEIEVGGRINDNWTVDFNLAYVDTEYTRYQYNFGAARLGFSDMKGNSVPRVPEYTAFGTTTYRWTVSNDMNAFLRLDANYFGKTFTEERNLNYMQAYTIFNLRGGIETDAYRLEVFVTNLTDEEAWASGARFSDTAFATDFGNFFVEQGINVSPNDKRELGIRAQFRF